MPESIAQSPTASLGEDTFVADFTEAATAVLARPCLRSRIVTALWKSDSPKVVITAQGERIPVDTAHAPAVQWVAADMAAAVDQLWSRIEATGREVAVVWDDVADAMLEALPHHISSTQHDDWYAIFRMGDIAGLRRAARLYAADPVLTVAALREVCDRAKRGRLNLVAMFDLALERKLTGSQVAATLAALLDRDAWAFIEGHPGCTTDELFAAVRPTLSRREWLSQIHREARSRGCGQLLDGRWFSASASPQIAACVRDNRPSPGTERALAYLSGDLRTGQADIWDWGNRHC